MRAAAALACRAPPKTRKGTRRKACKGGNMGIEGMGGLRKKLRQPGGQRQHNNTLPLHVHTAGPRLQTRNAFFLGC